MKIEDEAKEKHTIFSINERLNEVIKKSKNAEKYQMLKKGLDLTTAIAIGLGVPTIILAAGSVMGTPFVDEVRATNASNILSPIVMDSFKVIAAVALAYYGSNLTKKHVNQKSTEIEIEYSNLKNDITNITPVYEHHSNKIEEFLKHKVNIADVMSPNQRENTDINELSERKEKRKTSFKFA